MKVEIIMMMVFHGTYSVTLCISGKQSFFPKWKRNERKEKREKIEFSENSRNQAEVGVIVRQGFFSRELTTRIISRSLCSLLTIIILLWSSVEI